MNKYIDVWKNWDSSGYEIVEVDKSDKQVIGELNGDTVYEKDEIMGEIEYWEEKGYDGKFARETFSMLDEEGEFDSKKDKVIKELKHEKERALGNLERDEYFSYLYKNNEEFQGIQAFDEVMDWDLSQVDGGNAIFEVGYIVGIKTALRKLGVDIV